MSWEPIDAWEEAGTDAIYEQVMGDPSVREQFYQELYDEIIRDFTDARLRSFYENHPDLAKPAETALADAKRLLGQDDTAAFLFGAIAAEVGLISTLLKPIVHGLVHAESAAALITRLAIRHNDENLTKILLDLLADHGKVDPRHFKRSGSAQTLWEELSAVRTKRNAVVHRADRASHGDAELAVSVAAAVLGDLFPTVVKNLGLHFHGSTVCNVVHR